MKQTRTDADGFYRVDGLAEVVIVEAQKQGFWSNSFGAFTGSRVVNLQLTRQLDGASLESLLVGHWEGSSTVESAVGVLPSCIAPFWKTGFTDRLAADVQKFEVIRYTGNPLDLRLTQQASESCHVQVGGSPSQIAGTPWPFDEFDCALVPALCPYFCHARLTLSQWECSAGGTPPEAWNLGISMRAAFTDASQTRLQGTIEVPYDHRPASSTGGWTAVTIVKRFNLTKATTP